MTGEKVINANDVGRMFFDTYMQRKLSKEGELVGIVDIGEGCAIADKYVTKGIYTGFKDINEDIITTGDMVEIVVGESVNTAVVGIDANSNSFFLYYGTTYGSVGLGLSQKTIEKYQVKIHSEV